MTDVDHLSFLTPDAGFFDLLLPMARRVFKETFGQHYDVVEFERYCDGTYLPGGSMARDFYAPGVWWRVAVDRGVPVGYAKLTPLRAPFVDAAPGAVELQQIYVLSRWHGTGVADRLMEWGLTTARTTGAAEVYLTVFDHNERAKRFYARYGFEEVGRCTFQLGDRIEDDRIWRRQMTGDHFPDVQSGGSNVNS